MDSHGISDSFAEPAEPVKPCPACGGEAQVTGGACVSCLLRGALEPSDDHDPESFETLLAEVEIRDRDWRFGNYQILEEIGRGGMGVIYRARQRHSKRIVALKRVLSYHGDSHETLERFRREAEAAASLDHPNILPIYEVGEADGLPFFTMKYAPGGSLYKAAPRLRERVRECVELIAKVARAVSYAHKEGILHRDLKPGNILLDGRGEPLVSDFGLAKWMDGATDFTRSLAVFGTPGYIAPEQSHGPRALVGTPADIYSIGAILFELLAGRPPFLGEHALAVIRQAADSAAPRLRSLLPSADRDLETICAKCLEREPEARYASAADLAEDLERWLKGCSIVARPVSPTVRGWRWSKRNPLLAGAMALCLLLGGVAVTRQIGGWRLQQQLETRIAAQHSVEVLPVVDLDTAQRSDPLTRDLGRELEKRLGEIGPATVRIRATGDASTEGASKSEPQERGATRSVLSVTMRTGAGKRRIALNLLQPGGRAALLHRIIEVGTADDTASSVARQVAREIYQVLSIADLSSVAPRTSDPGLLDLEAKSFIEQGLELAARRRKVDLDRSVACLQHAVELQPNSSAAHAALAKVYGYKAAFNSSREPISAGLEHAHKAVALNPANPDAHLNLAGLLYHSSKINEAIERTFTAIEASCPLRQGANLLSNNYKRIGRPDKALLWLEAANGWGPTTINYEAALGDCFTYLADDERAEVLYMKHRKRHPEQPDGWVCIARLRLLNRRFDEARALYRRETRTYTDFTFAAEMAAQVEFFGRDFAEAEKLYTQLYEQDPLGGGNFYAAVSYASALGRIKMETDPAAGRELLEQARKAELEIVGSNDQDPAPFYRLAATEASLGLTDAALAHLRAAAEAGWIDYRSLGIDPRFDSLRDDPVYARLIEQMSARVASLRNAVLAKGELNLIP